MKKIYFLLDLDSYEVLKSIVVDEKDVIAISYFRKTYDERMQSFMYSIDYDAYKNCKLYYDDERDCIVSEQEIYNYYLDLNDDCFCGSFQDFVSDCCGKNGCLNLIYKN